VFAALTQVRARRPFPLLGIDSDNGSEFINDELLRYANHEHLTFTRSRPGRKNDGAHIEQKNWSVVRRYVGDLRYDLTFGRNSRDSQIGKPRISPENHAIPNFSSNLAKHAAVSTA
jgi:hypothetical protein